MNNNVNKSISQINAAPGTIVKTARIIPKTLFLVIDLQSLYTLQTISSKGIQSISFTISGKLSKVLINPFFFSSPYIRKLYT